MKHIKSAMLLAGMVMQSVSFGASYNGSPNFDQYEIDQHKRKIYDFVQVGKACLERYERDHKAFRSNPKHCIGNKCVSKYFGNRRYSKRKNDRRASDGKALTYLPSALAAEGFPTSIAREMENLSCVDMALRCTKEAFLQTGQDSAWNKLRNYVVSLNEGRGTVLQDGLNQLGWTTFYWNPSSDADMKLNAKAWDRQETYNRVMDEFGSPAFSSNGKPMLKPWAARGQHWDFYAIAKRSGRYFANRVDNMTAMVGFGKQTPQILRDTPYWVGTAHGGYHVFPGSNQRVIEAHSTRSVFSADNLEFSDFNPMANGGGPRWSAHEKYRSGIIMIPPMYTQYDIDYYNQAALQNQSNELLFDQEADLKKQLDLYLISPNEYYSRTGNFVERETDWSSTGYDNYVPPVVQPRRTITCPKNKRKILNSRTLSESDKKVCMKHYGYSY